MCVFKLILSNVIIYKLKKRKYTFWLSFEQFFAYYIDNMILYYNNI